MNRKFVVAFAAVCIAVSLGAAFSVAYRILAGDAAGKRAAKADFEGLRSVLAYVRSPSDLADASLRARLASRYEASPNLLLVDVYERGSGDSWRIPVDSPYLPGARAASALPEPVYPLISTILLSSPLKGDTSGRMAVDALYTSLSQFAAFSAFRDAFIALASFLALAALVLALVSAWGGTALSQAAAVGAQGNISRAALDMAAAGAQYQYETLVAAKREQRAAVSGDEAKDPAALDSDFDIPIISDSAAEQDSAALGVDQAASAGDGSGACGPEGLYSPNSGLGWESYLDDRLDAEISRSASFEQDLSLLVISYEGLDSSNKHYAAIGSAIQKFFSFRDLAFERGEDGFSVILPNIDSSHALRMAEEFLKKLVFAAGGDFAELDRLPIYMGISSRSGRLVDSPRLVEEASAAMEKARAEKDTHIVAFRPDPDKYRLYLASKGA